MEDLKGPEAALADAAGGRGAQGARREPIAMPVPQVPESLAQRVIDGAVIPWEVVPALKVHELVKFHTEIPGSPTLYTASFTLAMNKPKDESLPAELKAVIDKHSGQVAARPRAACGTTKR